LHECCRELSLIQLANAETNLLPRTAMNYSFGASVAVAMPRAEDDLLALARERKMPDVLIEVRGDWVGDRKPQFIDAIHAALVETIKIPADDKVLRFVAYAPDDFITPPALGARFTRIEITMFAGRSFDAKRKLYKAIVRNLEPFGVPAKDVKVVLIEVPAENWGVRGGHAACDIDLGFEIRV
jgi:phenylpyruvate tautomerase PptA (4-oxalocrotonate tautomerase family)